MADKRVVWVSWRPWFRRYREGGFDGYWSFGRKANCQNVEMAVERLHDLKMAP